MGWGVGAAKAEGGQQENAGQVGFEVSSAEVLTHARLLAETTTVTHPGLPTNSMPTQHATNGVTSAC